MSPLFGNVYQSSCKSDFMSGMRGKTPINQFLFVRTVTLCIVIAMKDDKDQRIHVTHQNWTNTGFCELYLEASRQRELARLLMLLSAIKSQKY